MSLERAIDEAREKYPTLSRGQLQKKNHALYTKIARQGDLNKLPLASRYQGNPYKFYTTHYPGKTRGEIYKIDRPLHSSLNYYNMLDKLPGKKIIKKKVPSIIINYFRRRTSNNQQAK